MDTMSVMRAAIATVLTVLAVAATARAESGTDHVRVDLLADTTAVQPGEPFTVGVRFHIDPGWHIYWTNPGDSGLPTEVKLHLPPGFTAGPVQYPVPQVLRLPGDVTNYGYEREVMLLVPVTPPATVAVGTTVPILADSMWLVCQDRCLPGRSTTHLTLTVAAAIEPDNTAAFAAARRRLPRPCTAELLKSEMHMSVVSRQPMRVACTVEVTWKAVPTDISWVPFPLADWTVDDMKVNTAEGHTDVSFTLAPLTKTERLGQVEGLMVYTAGGYRKGLDIPVMAPFDVGPH